MPHYNVAKSMHLSLLPRAKHLLSPKTQKCQVKSPICLWLISLRANKLIAAQEYENISVLIMVVFSLLIYCNVLLITFTGAIPCPAPHHPVRSAIFYLLFISFLLSFLQLLMKRNLF